MRFGCMLFAAMLVTGSAERISDLASPAEIRATPLILEKGEGETRIRRPRETGIVASEFMIKVDRQNGGSQKMWLGTEQIAPGAVIAKHKHVGQDEILLLRTGSAHVWLGTEERDVHAGAVVFIPSDTWISLKNTGNEVIDLAFVFSDPGFDEFMRCVSVAKGESASRMVERQEFQACEHRGHVEYEQLPKE